MVVKTSTDFKFQYEHEETIAQGCLTNSKHPDRFIKGYYPNSISSGYGAILFNTNGRQYVDYICGLGTCIFGYANKHIVKAIENELHKGVSYSLPSKTELDAGRRVKGLMPFIERLKFLKTGSEAALASIRIARAYTGRSIILSEGYHGWGDEFVSLTPPARGVMENPYIRKLENINQINKDVAAVIVEPVMLDNSVNRTIWLNDLRKKCDENGTVLIFDEIITGVRYKKFCVANYMNINPDLILLGKGLAGGLPLSIVGGRKELMDNPEYFVSSTYAGENASLAAFLKVCDLLEDKYNINDLWSNAQFFQDQFNALWPEKIHLHGYGIRSVFKGDPHTIAVLWQEAAEAGYIFGPSLFYMFNHEEFMYKTMNDLKDIIMKMKIKMPRLKGPAPSSPFSTKQRS